MSNLIKDKRITSTLAIMVLLAALYFLVFKPSADIKNVDGKKSDPRQESLSLFNKGKLKDALPGLEAVDSRIKNDTEVKTALAFAYRALGDKEKAFKKYEEIIEYDKNNAGTHLRLGVYYRIEKQYDKSKSHLEQAVKIQRNPQFLVELSKTYEAQGQLDKASELLKQASKATTDAAKNELIKQAETVKSQDGI